MITKNLFSQSLAELFSGNQGAPEKAKLSAAHNEWNHAAVAAIEDGYFLAEGLTDVEWVVQS
jgi:hypothetical protein